ncbi:PAS domain-containing protein [Desulfococcaceae bacterium HSG7]|nr:PAS domain-containing protein [Desulfococcaceae bacterium HSG9]MDM8556088.1 PAS domain-containing protein [Desulfococcaceae bacterium HSG7]
MTAKPIDDNLEKRVMELEKDRDLAAQILETVNRSGQGDDLIKKILFLIKKHTGFEAVGIRLKQGEDYPYYVTSGFPSVFVEAEKYLCARSQTGELIRDSHGNVCLECMCGNVLCGRTNPKFPFFSEGGSFWSNTTTRLLATTTEKDRQARTRNRCNSEGYESVALIPLRAGEMVIGLLQLNDRRKNRFYHEKIAFYEKIGASIGVSFARQQKMDELKKAKEIISRSPAVAFLWKNADSWPVEYVSDNVTQLFGYSAAEFTSGQVSYASIIYSDDMERVAQEVLTFGKDKTRKQFYHQPYRIVTKNGEIKWLDDRTHIRRDNNGNITHYEGIVLDITDHHKTESEKKRLELQLQQSQRMNSVGKLAGGVAHEINNPINGIMNYAQLISDRLDKDSPLTEYASEIIGETERVATIVRNLLTFARDEKQNHSLARMVDIAETTLSLIRTVMGRDQISLEVDIPVDLPLIRCRSQQIQQALMSLITNACDALNQRYPEYDPNKKLSITSRMFVKNGQDWIRTTVQDNGIGIAPEVRKQMFDPFFSTYPRDRKAGLGLSVSYSIVQEHRGELHFESEPKQYTRFHLDLPADNGWKVI